MTLKEPEGVEFTGHFPGAIGEVIRLHGAYYHEHWGFDASFEAQEAGEIAEFFSRLDEKRDLFLAARVDGGFAGSIAIDGAAKDGARLRWFIVDPAHQRRGIGAALLKRALDFCKKAGHERVFLWTFEGLDEARRLYERAGFRLAKERDVEQWGGVVREQMFELPHRGS